MSGTDAYVLVQGNHTDHLARSLLDVPGVVFAEDVRGPYDALALARPNGTGETLQEIVEEIRALPGVIRALAAPRAPDAAAPAATAA
jgi:hypothetical protein